MTAGCSGAGVTRAPSVAAGAARALMEFAISRGANPEALAERSGIRPSDLDDRDQRIPLAQYVTLMRVGQELCRDPALALHFGESVPMTDLSLGPMVGASSETMAEGLALINRYAPLTIDVEIDGPGDRFVFERLDGRVWIIDRRANPNDFPELTESSFARMVASSRGRMAMGSSLQAVHVTHGEPSYRAEYDRIFRAPVTFDSDRNALLSDDAWMARRPPHASRPVHEALKAHSEALLERLESSQSVRGRVEALLAPLLSTRGATMDAIASRLGLSRPSLFRRLKAEGVTFEEVLDGLRHRLALRYLEREGLAVKETAFRLGFSEPASFSRAFKRWTGKSPLAIRRKQTH